MLPNITLPHPATVVPLAPTLPALRLAPQPPAPQPASWPELASPPPYLATQATQPPAPTLAPVIPRTAQEVAPADEPDYDKNKTEAELTGEYIALRDAKREAEAKHKEEVEARYNVRMDEIEKKMLARLTAADANSVKTSQGTAFKKTVTKFSVADDSFFAWVEANHQTDMLVKGIRQTAVADYVEAHSVAPPGVAVFSEVVVQFRK